MQSNYESLTKFTEEINRQESTKQDWIVPTNLMTASDNGNFNLQAMANDDIIFDEPVSDYAQHQIAQLYDIPVKYWDAMKNVEGLRSKNANAWFTHNPKPRMVRVLDNNIRALVSNKFKPFDNFMVLNAIMPTLVEYRSDMNVVANTLTEKRMYLQIRFPSVNAEIKPGDIVQAGFIITNSEVGAGSLDIREAIWRLVCRNGMIRESVFKQYHIGRAISNNEEDYNIYSEETLTHEINAVKGKMHDIVSYALETANFEESIEDLRIAANRKIENVIETTKNVTKRFNVPEKYIDQINQNIYTNNELNQWGMANAITGLAHLVDNPDTAYDFEQLGDKVIKLNDNEWSKITSKN